MLLTAVAPIVQPQDYSYKTTDGTLRIYVGFDSEDATSEDNWTLRHWVLKNKDNVIIASGDVNVLDGTFESFVDLSDLEMETVYMFTIQNGVFENKSATINSLSSIQVVDEAYVFSEEIALYGDVEPSLTDSITDVKLRFPDGWSLTRTLGSALIYGKTSEKWYTYCPSRIYTRRRGVSSVDFTPVAGTAEVSVPVYQLPDIRRSGEYKYLVTPPTKLKVKITYGLTTVNWTSSTAVSSLNLRDIDQNVRGVVKVEIRSVFPA